MWKKFGLLVFVAGIFLASAPSALAVKFDLVPPSGTLTRGQDVTFTINIDTQGSTVNNIQTGITYDTTYLQYVSAAAGAAMESISVDTSQGTGKLLLTGTSSSGFTGSGVFSTVVFKLIAEQSGETELCSLWQPTTTPTTAPACNSTCTSNTDCTGGMSCYVVGGQTTGVCRNLTCPDQTTCVCPQPTSPPVPTALPQTGFELPRNTGLIAGTLFLAVAGGFLLYMKKNTYTEVAQKHQAHHKKTPSHKKSS